MRPTPHTKNVILDWWNSPGGQDPDDRSHVKAVLQSLELRTHGAFYRDLSTPGLEIIILRPGLRIAVEFYPGGESDLFEVISIFEDADADDDPWGMP